MKLLLIRHGDPDYARDALTPKGYAEAQLLAEALAHVPMDEIYVSPMGRAQLTAQYTLQKIGLEATTLDWLAELNGNYRDSSWCWSLPPAEVMARPEPYSASDWPRQTDYGEHMAEVVRPFYAQFDELMRWHGYAREGFRYRVLRPNMATLAFFCHGGVILTLLGHLLQVPIPVAYAQFWVDTASITSIGFDEYGGYAACRLLAWNDTSHLAPLRGPIHAQPYPRR